MATEHRTKSTTPKAKEMKRKETEIDSEYRNTPKERDAAGFE
jgi:selenocysteine-specific translation elongation factor